MWGGVGWERYLVAEEAAWRPQDLLSFYPMPCTQAPPPHILPSASWGPSGTKMTNNRCSKRAQLCPGGRFEAVWPFPVVCKDPQHSTDSSRLRTSSLQTWFHESYCAPGSPDLALLLVLGNSFTRPRAAARGRPHLSYSWVLLCLPPLPPLHTKAPHHPSLIYSQLYSWGKTRPVCLQHVERTPQHCVHTQTPTLGDVHAEPHMQSKYRQTPPVPVHAQGTRLTPSKGTGPLLHSNR